MSTLGLTYLSPHDWWYRELQLLVGSHVNLPFSSALTGTKQTHSSGEFMHVQSRRTWLWRCCPFSMVGSDFLILSLHPFPLPSLRDCHLVHPIFTDEVGHSVLLKLCGFLWGIQLSCRLQESKYWNHRPTSSQQLMTLLPSLDWFCQEMLLEVFPLLSLLSWCCRVGDQAEDKTDPWCTTEKGERESRAVLSCCALFGSPLHKTLKETEVLCISSVEVVNGTSVPERGQLWKGNQ